MLAVVGNGLRIVGDEQTIDADMHRERYEWAAKVINRGSAVLDYGCGTGYGADLFVRAHEGRSSCLGFDIDPAAVEYGKQRWTPFLTSDWNTVMDSRNRWDAVMAFEILEHLEERPVDAVRRLFGITPLVVASVPYRERGDSEHPNPHHRHFVLDERNFDGLDCEFMFQPVAGAITQHKRRPQNMLIIAHR